jgi:NADH:ubiquinone oxidoreductase subunit K
MLLVVCLAAFELLLVLALFFAPWRRFRELGRSGPAVPRMRRRAALRMVAPVVLLLVAEVVVFFLLAKRRSGAPGAPALLTKPPPHSGVPNLLTTVTAATVPEATALAAGVGLVIVLAILVARYRSRSKAAVVMADPSQLPQELSSAIDQSLAELAAGADPRQAVIAVYERMERVLAGVGLPAQAFETPLEYLERALARLQASRGALVRLTDLFETARFSTHPVGSGMRSEAEAALGILRAELAG